MESDRNLFHRNAELFLSIGLFQSEEESFRTNRTERSPRWLGCP